MDSQGRLTPDGRAMAQIPAHPRLARALLEGARRGCAQRAGLWAAFLSERDPFDRENSESMRRHLETDDRPSDVIARERMFLAWCGGKANRMSIDSDAAREVGHAADHLSSAALRAAGDLAQGSRGAQAGNSSDEAIAECAEKAAQLRGRGLAVCGAYACGVFEQAKHWLGDAETLTMAFESPGHLGDELDRVTEWKMAIYGAYARAGVDIVWIGDDLGAQDRLIMSPEHYRQWYRPRHLRIVEHLRSIRADLRIAFHCCGHATPLIPDLIEIGIDILEAVQPECMDLAELKREFGRDLSFWGGIGLQSILARTSPEQVDEGVRGILSVLAPGGGYLAAPCHTLTEEVPWEIAVACQEAVQRYGVYPIVEDAGGR